MRRAGAFVVLLSALGVACGSGGAAGEPDVAADSVVEAWPDTLPPASGVLKVYVAGESIERRNRFVAPPFQADGSLNERGGGDLRNDDEEYGWMVPMADRLRLRAPDLAFEYVGADDWLSADDLPYSGTYPSSTPGRSSAISGTDIGSWMEQRLDELHARTHCYQVAFAARGGNDFGWADDDTYKTNLTELILALDAGSSCLEHPLVAVTAHLPDDQRDGSVSDAEYVTQQKHRFVERTVQVIDALAASHPEIRARFVDQYTPFIENRATTAFPAEAWSADGVPDFAKISRTVDAMHPRRLASIYAGELAADALDLDLLRSLAP